MSSQEMSTTAFILSLVGGVLIIAGGSMSMMWFGYDYSGMMGGFWGMMGGIMGGYRGMMGNIGIPYGLMAGISLIGVLSGILMILGAMMLNIRPADHTIWGTIILIFSLMSFLGMGGFFIGAILGIVGGALALSWKPIPKA